LSDKIHYDALVIGAGAAGLAASRVLTAAGWRVAVLEARDRIGGRISTRHEMVSGFGDVPVEVGAEFIHGLPASTWNLVREARLDTYELDGSQLCFEASKLQHCGSEQRQTFEVIESMSAWLRDQPPHTDMTFANFLLDGRIDAGSAERASRYVEGFNAADRNIVGIAGLARQQDAEDKIQGDRIFHVSGGYESVTRFLCREFIAQGGMLLLQHPISTVSWKPGKVSVGGRDSSGKSFEFTANRMVSTLPLGVIQAGAVNFEPAIPEFVQQASRMRMGAVLRVSLVFDRAFWREADLLSKHESVADELESLSFLFARDTHWPTWWTPAPNGSPVITAWIAGPRVATMDHSRISDLALEDAARIFSLSTAVLRERLIGSHWHDWQADSYARGAYSYVPAGSLDASERMTQPCKDTLYFAGEHTDVEGHWGTVHAALNSGLRAAAQLLQAR
jgi:monoamine oxidase